MADEGIPICRSASLKSLSLFPNFFTCSRRVVPFVQQAQTFSERPQAETDGLSGRLVVLPCSGAWPLHVRLNKVVRCR